MPTTINATPQPATASVLLEITTDGPEPVLAEPPDELDWTLTGGMEFAPSGGEPGSVALWWATIDTGEPWAAVTVDDLTPGDRYRAELRYLRYAPGRFEVEGVEGVPLSEVEDLARTRAVVEFTATATSHTLRVRVWNLWSAVTVEALTLHRLPPEYAFTLTRSDANGVRPVRLYANEDPATGGLLVVDHEAAVAGPITYTVTTDTTVTATTALDLDETWLSVPVLPQHSVRLGLVTGYAEESPSQTTVHEIIGSEYPAFTLRPLGRRRGSLVLWCATYADAVAVLALYRRGETLLLRQPDYPGLDLYHVATGRVSISPADDDAAPASWHLTVEYHEAPVPTAPLSGALGWDYAAAAELHPTYAESYAAFPTYADRYVGPT